MMGSLLGVMHSNSQSRLAIKSAKNRERLSVERDGSNPVWI